MDPYVSFDPSTQDLPHALIANLYPDLAPLVREGVQRIVLAFLDELARDDASSWRGTAGDHLLMLVEPVLHCSRWLPEAVELLLRCSQAIRTSSTQPNLHFRTLQTLVALGHRSTYDFWRSVFAEGGERYANLVLEGLARISLTQAMRWVAEVEWTPVVETAMFDLLPVFSENYGAARVSRDIESVLPLMTDEKRAAVIRLAAAEGLLEIPAENRAAATGQQPIREETAQPIELLDAERTQQARRIAEEKFRGESDWVRFYRQVLGVNGLIDRLFRSRDQRNQFEKTAEYIEIQQMLAELRQRNRIQKQCDEPTRVITVRLPQSLHEALRHEAHNCRTSVNQLCVSKLLQAIEGEFVPSDFERHEDEECELVPSPALTPQPTLR